MEDLKSFSKSQGALEADKLDHWDIGFWSERLRESKYEINEVDSLSLLSPCHTLFVNTNSFQACSPLLFRLSASCVSSWVGAQSNFLRYLSTWTHLFVHYFEFYRKNFGHISHCQKLWMAFSILRRHFLESISNRLMV